MKKVLITGKNSYLGTAVEQWLSKKPDFNTDTIDMKLESWKTYDFTGYDTVFHAAGIAHADVDNVSEERKRLYYQVNTKLAEETARKAKEAGVGQFIYMSSMIIYGESSGIGKRKVITRDTIPSPANFYGDSKWEGEKRVRALAGQGFITAVLRPPMIYGQGAKGNYQALRQLALRLPVFPAIKNERSMLHIDRFCQVVEILVREQREGIFFPQDEDYVNTSELVKKIAEENGKKIWVTRLLNPLVYALAAFPNKKTKVLVKKAFGNLVYEKEMSTGL